MDMESRNPKREASRRIVYKGQKNEGISNLKDMAKRTFEKQQEL